MDKTESFEEFKNKNLHLFSLRKIKSEAFEFIWDYLTEKHNKEIALLKVKIKDKEIIQKERDDLLIELKKAEKEIKLRGDNFNRVYDQLELLTKCADFCLDDCFDDLCQGCRNKKLIEDKT